VVTRYAIDPPGWVTRSISGGLGLLQRGGVPFLRGADERDLRGLALGIGTAARRITASAIVAPPSSSGWAEDDVDPFLVLADDDRAALLSDNREAFEFKCAAVDAARESIDCALFYVADDDAGARFAAALTRAVARGVKVRLGVDRLVTIEKQYGPAGFAASAERGSWALLQRLEREGVGLHVLGDDRWCMHRKFLLVDGASLIIGGRNVADHYASDGWRDLEIHFTGPLARSFARVAELTFNRPLSPASPESLKGVVLGVPGRRGAAFANAVTRLVERTRSTLDVEHAYVLEQAWFVEALARAIDRGVRVRLFTNSGTSNDLPFINWRMATTHRLLLRAGTSVHRRREAGATLHTKAIVGDARYVVFGSTNLDYYSATYCAEVDLAIDSAILGGQLASFIEEGVQASSTEAVLAGTPAAAALARESRALSVSRCCDWLLHDMQ